jgi:hypothetical protein
VAGKFGLSVFFFFFFALGSLFEVFILREFGRAVGQWSWKKVPCTIAGSEVQERGGSEEPFAFVVQYKYEYGGRSYAGSAYKRRYSGTDKYTKAQRLVQKYPSGSNASCYVNPANAAEAVLKRDSAAIGLVFFFPLIFVAIGAGGIYCIWRRQPPEAKKPIAATAVRKRGRSKYAVAAFFGIFAIVGGALLYPLGIKPIARTIDAESWVETPCRVVRAEVRSHDSDDGTTYSVYILYQYQFDGQTYKCDRYDFVGGSSSGYRGKARIVAAYEAAANPICYVNPDDPSDAVLKRGFQAKLLLALFPLPFLLVGVIGAYYTLRGKKAPSAATAEPWSGAPSRVVSDDLTVLRAADTGRVVLEPKFSARMKFVGIVLAALFWNGIISVFLIGIVNDFRHGDASWFPALFMLPFVAVGIGLIAFAVYQLLAMFNPRPTLELSAGAIPLGGAAELCWSFAGQTSRIGEFSVTLRGTEEARYRRGTNTYTDRNKFYEMELYRTSHASEIASGQVGFIVPQDTMHSFEAENNKVLWNLDIHGDIRRWPDVKESFKITVTPTVA